MLDDDIEKALQLSARFIDITFQEAKSLNITTKDGVAKDISNGESSGFGVRVLDKTWGFASSTEGNGLLEAATRALKAAQHGEESISFEPRDGVVDKVRTKVKRNPLDVPIEEKIELGRRAFDSIKDLKAVVSSSFTYVDSVISGVYANSEGTRIEWNTTKTAFFGSVYAKKNSSLQVGSERRGATAGFEFMDGPEGMAKLAADKALRLLDAKAAPSGTFTVVLDPQLTGVFIHEALGHAVEADHVLNGESILEGRIGEMIASEHVTVYDDPTIEGSFGFYHYDSEGTPANRTTLIEKGVLEGYLHSRETSSALGMQNTGNARAQGFDCQPVVRMSNTFMGGGSHTLEELFEGVKHGVYLRGSKGGEVDTARGVFQFSAEEGFLIEGGRLSTPLRDVALSGETLQILNAVDAVGGGFDMHIGFCGKEGQSVPVGDGGSPIRTKASVGGMQ